MSRHSLLQRLFPSHENRSPRRAQRRRIFFEPLEERRVLAVALTLDGSGGGGNGSFVLDSAFELDGDLDGDVGTEVSGGADIVWDTALQPDGKIVVVGEVAGNINPDIAIVRYNANGTLDSSFGVGGKVILHSFVGSTTDEVNGEARAVAIQEDGKILVAGRVLTSGGQQNNFLLLRLNAADGALDATFGTGGVVTTDFGNSSDLAEDVAIQGDGRIVAVGTREFTDVAMARYDTNGALDTSFDGDGPVAGNGKIVLNINNSPEEVATGVVIQPDQKILVASQHLGTNFAFEVAITRLDGSNGSRDTTFGSAGTSFTPFPSTESSIGGFVEALALDGTQIVAVGTVLHNLNLQDVFVLRLNGDGSPDSNFDGDNNGNGLVISNFGVDSSDKAFDLAIQPDHKIVVAGATDNGVFNADDFLVARYNDNGTLDETFATGGFIREDFGIANTPQIARGLALTPTGLVLAGSLELTSTPSDFALVRYVEQGGGPVALPPINEGQPTTLSGTFTKDSTGTATIMVQWGDTTSDTISVSGTSGTFSITRPYLDNPASGPTFTISATLDDGVNGSDSEQATIAVSNVAPAFISVTSATIDEGGTATITGSFGDAGIVPTNLNLSLIDTHTIVVTWGDSSTSAATIDPLTRTFSASHLFADDGLTSAASDIYNVTLALTDDENAAAPGIATTVQVNNVAPVASLAGPAVGLRGQAIAFTGSFADAGVLDTHQVKWSFGDGTEIPFQPSTNAGALAPSHSYASNGVYPVTLTVKDDDGGEHSVTENITIVSVLLETAPSGSGTAVAIGGTDAADHIAVNKVTGGVEVIVNSVNLGVWSPTQAIVAYGYGGDDEVQIAGSIMLTAWLYGGNGHDKLKGAGGHDVLLGQDGDDLLVGGSGRDILIGGTGSDRIVGNHDDDILIAGTTDHDASTVALSAILAEWTADRCDYVRVANLYGVGCGPRNNGNVFLNDDTVHDDGVRDLLTGSSGFDWFFANLSLNGDDSPVKDKITDLSWWEFAKDIDFIES